MDQPYTEWFKEVQELSLKLYGLSVVDTDGWENYYNCDYTPRDALNEDMNYELFSNDFKRII